MSWEVGIRNPCADDSFVTQDPREEIGRHGARTWLSARGLAEAVVKSWPHLITYVRPKRATPPARDEGGGA